MTAEPGTDVRRQWLNRRSGAGRHSDEARSPFEVDYARVVHSSSFRRLQGKTQILALGDDDFYRTRLTHSMEVAQVAQGIVQQLRHGGRLEALHGLEQPAALVATAGLAHDLGHPPFGHSGELALNYCMRDAGGFEGNAQTLRILSRLEEFSGSDGADLTRRALLAILKYPAPRSRVADPDVSPALAQGPTTLSLLDRRSCEPAKSFYDDDAEVAAWILALVPEADADRFGEVASRPGRHGKTVHKSFDCSVMDVADDIAYGVHDLEDAIALGLVDEERFREAVGEELCGALVHALRRRPLDGVAGYDGFVRCLFDRGGTRKRAVGRLVHMFLRAVEVAVDREFEEPLLAHTARLDGEHALLLGAFQALVVAEVIESPRVQHFEFKGQRMVVAVFEAMASDPARLLPTEARRRFDASADPQRVLCDHVSAMTDGALLKAYERLFSPRVGSVFDKL